VLIQVRTRESPGALRADDGGGRREQYVAVRRRQVRNARV